MFQWLGWNWILARVGLKINEQEINELSRKEIFIKMISENFEYFPSLFEI